jgi:hypothetical protein
MISRRPFLIVVLAALVGLAVPTGAGAAAKRCGKVENPFAGTRYEGEDVKRIRARGVTCRRARRVAVRAQRKALGQPQPANGIRRFRYRGWKVTGDTRRATDRYVARRDGKVVRWRF